MPSYVCDICNPHTNYGNLHQLTDHINQVHALKASRPVTRSDIRHFDGRQDVTASQILGYLNYI